MAVAPILVLTHSQDHYVPELVVDALAVRGAHGVRINTDAFPAVVKLRQDAGPCGALLVLDDPHAGSIDLHAVPAALCRRLWPGAIGTEVPERYRAACAHASATLFVDALTHLQGCTLVNHPARNRAAESKVWQHALARQVGLHLPPTLVTNDPDAVRAFYAQHHGRIITKLLVPHAQTMQPGPDMVYTARVTREDLDHLEGLRWAPQIFQPLVDKQAELRVAVVGKQMFVGSIDTRSCARASLDWRRATMDDGLRWEAGALDEATATALMALMDRMGLLYGAADFIVPPGGGPPVFLEMNPAGEWGFLQKDLGFPIAEALAEVLLGQGRRL